MARNVINEYSKKAQEILTRRNDELAKLNDEIVAQEQKISEAESEMESAMTATDQDAWKKANKKKRDASDSIEWSKIRLEKLKKDPIIDNAELEKVQNEITAHQQAVADDATKKIKELIGQAKKIIAEAEEDIRSGNNVKGIYAVDIAKTADNMLSSSAKIFDTGFLASTRAHFERAENSLS